MWVNNAEFARIVDCSRSNVTQGIRAGRIKAEYLQRNESGKVQRINTAALADWKATGRPYQKPWEQVAAEYLGPDWGPPPWSAEQWQTVAMVCDLAREAASHS